MMLTAITRQFMDTANANANAHLPIAKLPPDILLEIFHLCVSTFLQSFSLLSHSCTSQHPLAYTQVCFSWRLISLSSPHLWQRIDLGRMHPRLARMFLSRSRMAPLEIVMDGTASVFFTTLSAVLLTVSGGERIDDYLNTNPSLSAYAERLLSIDVQLYPHDMRLLFDDIGSKLLTLRNLSIKLPLNSPTHNLGMPYSLNLLLDIFSPSSLLNLRKLTLDGVALKWELLKDLTYLSVDLGPESDLGPSVDQILGIFERSQGLTYARFNNLSSTKANVDAHITTHNNNNSSVPFPNGSRRTDPIHLPYLKSIILSGHESAISVLISSVRIDRRTKVQIFCRVSDMNDIFTGLMFVGNSSSRLRERGPDTTGSVRGGLPVVERVKISKHSLHIFPPDMPAAFPSTSPSSAPIFSLVSSSPLPLQNFSLNSFVDSLPFLFPLPSASTMITKLELATGFLTDLDMCLSQTSPSMRRAALGKMFACLKAVEELYVGFNNLEDLIGPEGILTEITESDIEGDNVVYTNATCNSRIVETHTHGNPRYAPNLWRLSFGTPTQSASWSNFAGMWLDALVTSLRIRKVKRVEFWRCKGFDELESVNWLKELRGLADEVVFLGYVNWGR